MYRLTEKLTTDKEKIVTPSFIIKEERGLNQTIVFEFEAQGNCYTNLSTREESSIHTEYVVLPFERLQLYCRGKDHEACVLVGLFQECRKEVCPLVIT